MLEPIHAGKACQNRSGLASRLLLTVGVGHVRDRGGWGALAASDIGFDTTFETHRSRDRPAVIGLPTVMPDLDSV